MLGNELPNLQSFITIRFVGWVSAAHPTSKYVLIGKRFFHIAEDLKSSIQNSNMPLLSRIISKTKDQVETSETLVLDDTQSILDLANIRNSETTAPPELKSTEQLRQEVLEDLFEDTLFFITQHRLKTRQNSPEAEIKTVEERLIKQLDCFAAFGDLARAFLQENLKTNDQQRIFAIKYILSTLND